ncbi:MAG TPA: carboxymuconolactone decarboxylase family protein [Anaerolineales bacterium]|nr:carboxymuconolactone decarboxylase family protein [Anaerolineales bacterium]
MKHKLDYSKVLPEGLRVMNALDRYSQNCGLEPALLDLIKLRASQINGCVYCVDMHSKDARTGGETEQRLYNLSIWRETPYYTDRERAALAFTEAVTLIADARVPDEVYEQARHQFSDEELVKLMIAIVTINAWNRFTIFGDVPGSYQPHHFVTQPRRAAPVLVTE